MVENSLLTQLETLLKTMGCPLRREEPLAHHTSMQVGGPADLFAQPTSREQIGAALRFCHGAGLPVLVMGKGSNLLVGDGGFRGLVLSLGSGFSHIRREGNLLYATAGTPLITLCKTAREMGLSGLEFAYGIPASVGGAVYMNAGAYGGEVKDVLHRVWALTPTGELREYAAKDIALSYRHSPFMESGEIILEAAFSLTTGEPAAIGARMEELMGRRVEKQPLEYPSAGSTFKRPEGAYAAALIDGCGLKGRRVGGAMISEKHAGFLINYDHATCREILDLIALVQEEVFAKTGYRLEREVQLVGEL